MKTFYLYFFLSFSFLAVNLSFSIDLIAQQEIDRSDKRQQKAGKSSRTYKKARVLQNSTAKKVVKIVEALERQKGYRARVCFRTASGHL